MTAGIDTEIEKPKRRSQITGKIKGTRLTLVRYSHHDDKSHRVNVYKCDCGIQKKIRMDHVMNGDVKSCGCWGKQMKGPERMQQIRDLPQRVDNLRKAFKERKIRRGHVPSPNKGRIRIEEPPGSRKYRYVTEQQLSDMFWGI
tara:strand:+ start:524 stop:952 length:429 start_codon:yes stop_codon:yes gene_type:complete